MNENVLLAIFKFILALLVLQLFVIGYVLYQSYEGRVVIVKAQRAGCERSKEDRNDTATGWRIAETARRTSGDLAIAKRYALLASSLEERGRIDCKKAFPKASFIP
jgi:hypothetical protein